MFSKFLPALINAIISFVIIVPLSFVMNRYMNHSKATFMAFFQEKWPILLTLVVVFTLYNSFLKGRKFK